MAEIDIERERYRLLIRIPRNEKNIFVSGHLDSQFRELIMCYDSYEPYTPIPTIWIISTSSFLTAMAVI